MIQHFFCPLCCREASVLTNGHYFCCGNEYVGRYTEKGLAYLEQSFSAWRDLNDKTYNAILFADAEAG